MYQDLADSHLIVNTLSRKFNIDFLLLSTVGLLDRCNYLINTKVLCLAMCRFLNVTLVKVEVYFKVWV